MNSLYNMDGVNSEEHRLEDIEFFVMENGQTITLPYAMYVEGLSIKKAIAFGGDEIAIDVTTISADRVDYDSMSVAMLMDPSFSGNIVKQLQVNFSNVDIGAGFGILVTGYAFETPYDKLLEDNSIGPIPTPGLMQHILQEVSFLTQSKMSPDSNIATLLQGNAPKEYDPTGESEVNHVRNEAHYINAHTGQSTIIPAAGDFYAHEVLVVDKESGQELPLGAGYELASLRMQKILTSDCPNPIYGRIIIKTALVGEVLISYHAVGGQATSAHYNQLASAISSVVDYIQTGGLVTTDSIHRTPGFIGMERRIHALEMQNGIFPNHQYTFTVDNSEFGWYTVGRIGFDEMHEIVRQGQYYLDVKIPGDSSEYRTITSIELTKPNALGVETLTSLGSPIQPVSALVVDLDQIDKSPLKFRIAYIGDPMDENTFKGGVLQIGHRGVSGSTFNPILTNRSHINSGLKLSEPGTVPTGMQNDNFIVTDSGDTWSSTNPAHHSAEHIVAHYEGELLWQGAIALNDVATSSQELDILWKDDAYTIADVKEIELLIKDRYTNSFMLVRESHSGDPALLSGSNLFHPPDMCMIRYALFKTELGVAKMTVDAELGTHSETMGRFELHRLVIKF